MSDSNTPSSNFPETEVSIASWFFVSLLVLLPTLGTGSPWFRIPTHYVICFFLFWMLGFFAFALLEGARRKSLSISIPLTAWIWMLFFAWGALGYFYSVRPEMSFPVSAIYLTAILLLLTMLVFFRRFDQIMPVMWTLLLLATAHGLLSLVIQIHYPETRFLGASIFGNKNFFGDYLIFPMAAGSLLFLTEETPGRKRMVWWLLVFIMTQAFFSASRGTLLAVAVVIGTLALGLLSLTRKREALWLFLILPVGFVGYQGLSFLVTAWMGHPLGAHAFAKDGSVNSMFFRQVIWSGAWKIFTQYPVAGTGPWTFKLVYPFQDIPYLWYFQYPGYTKPLLPHHAHNLFLHTAADMGVIGLGLLVAGFLFWLKRLWRTFRDETEELSLTALCLGAGLVGYLTHNFFEYCWPTPVFIYTLTIWLGMSLVVSRQFHHEVPDESSSKVVLIPGILLASVSLWALIALYGYNSALDEVRSPKNNTRTKFEYARKAISRCPQCDWPYLHMANASIQQWELTRDQRWADMAQQFLNEAGGKSEFNPQREILQGLLHEVQGNDSLAMRHYLNAYRTGHLHREVWTALKRLKKKKMGGEKAKKKGLT